MTDVEGPVVPPGFSSLPIRGSDAAMRDGMMVKADCNMAQAFEFPTVSRTTRPLPERLLLAELPSRDPGPSSPIADPSGHDAVRPDRQQAYRPSASPPPLQGARGATPADPFSGPSPPTKLNHARLF